MKLILVFLALLPCRILAQEMCVVTGSVKDSETGDFLPGAAISVKNSSKGAVSGAEGGYVLHVEPRSWLLFSSMGYQTDSAYVGSCKDTIIHATLKPSVIYTKEVVISGQREDENLVQTIDRVALNRDEIDKLPALLGQADPLKTIQLLPGVQSGGEGGSGIYVRGGAIDQNLILLDGAPIYNTGHLFGFFSLFNNAVLEEVNLIKGGAPASYGGRLSSVIDFKSRGGDYRRFKGEGSVGLIAANLLLEGPVVKDKASFLISGRRTYVDLLSKAITGSPTIFDTGIDYYFDDVNARLDVRLSDRDKIAFSGYTGADDFLFEGKNTLTNKIRWGSAMGSLHWEHFFNETDYHTLTLFGSRYQMNFSAQIGDYQFNISSSIKDAGARSEWTIEAGRRHKLIFGGEYLRHGIVPNSMRASGADTEFAFVEQEELFSAEEALFFSDEFNLNDRLFVTAGIRWSAYRQIGPFTRYETDESLSILDTVFYQNGKKVVGHHQWDPRVSATYRFNSRASLKASADRMHQYVHMAPVSSVSLPTDVWVPASAKLRPQEGWQYSLGYFQNFMNNAWETSVNLYYKKMENQIEYRDGVIVGYSKGFNFDDNFIFGSGESGGVELFIKKNKGAATGWLSYTVGKTIRTFDEINDGETFPAKYDRLHNLSLAGVYRIGDRLTASGVFVYSTGNALTLPVGRYIINGNIINEYEGRNTFRMPPYHRMDVSFTYTAAQRKKFESSWTFSVYNLYNRKNPYYIFFETRGNVNDYYLDVQLKKVALFPIIPSISYQFKF